MNKLRKNIHFLLIDAQFDFCDPQGSLYVNGADQDIGRIPSLLNRVGDQFADIHVTMDSHQKLHIANPLPWKNSKGEHPAPLTIITSQDMLNGIWTTTVPSHFSRFLNYLQVLESSTRADGTTRYQHRIWPPHCLIGSQGWSVYEPVQKALLDWCERNIATVDYVTKGSNVWTEHFSVVRAEVPDPKDPGTKLNTGLMDVLNKADEIPIAGVAGDICLAESVFDIADAFPDPKYVEKMVLLTDAIPAISNQRRDWFIDTMKKRGMRLSTTTDYLK